MPRNVNSFSFGDEVKTILMELDKIGLRENKSRSELIVQMITSYVSAHKIGNNQFTLDTSVQEGFLALPTMGEPLTLKFANMEDEEFVQIVSAARSRFQEIEKERKKRGLRRIDWWLD